MPETETIIGNSITVSGQFTSKENVIVLGKIVGQIETTAEVLVEDVGTIEAEVMTLSIDVRGSVVGNVTATDRFEVHPSGKVVGDVRAPRVILSDGCKYRGHIEVTTSGGH
jgi:cytoskeletal protein CcmA (bactofilin family)